MQFDEQKDQVTVERILRVVFLDPERPSPVRINSHLIYHHVIPFDFQVITISLCFSSFKALEKLKRQLAEADSATEARKKPPVDAGPQVVGEGLVIDEWVSI